MKYTVAETKLIAIEDTSSSIPQSARHSHKDEESPHIRLLGVVDGIALSSLHAFAGSRRCDRLRYDESNRHLLQSPPEACPLRMLLSRDIDAGKRPKTEE